MNERPVELICESDDEIPKVITVQLSEYDHEKLRPGETIRADNDIHYLITEIKGKKFYVKKLPGHPIHF